MAGHGKGGDARKVVLAALFGNLGISIAKFVAAWMSGSITMLAEGVHSVADTCNQGLLLIGMNLAMRRDADRYPLGRAKESYFWAFIVSLDHPAFRTRAAVSVPGVARCPSAVARAAAVHCPGIARVCAGGIRVCAGSPRAAVGGGIGAGGSRAGASGGAPAAGCGHAAAAHHRDRAGAAAAGLR